MHVGRRCCALNFRCEIISSIRVLVVRALSTLCAAMNLIALHSLVLMFLLRCSRRCIEFVPSVLPAYWGVRDTSDFVRFTSVVFSRIVRCVLGAIVSAISKRAVMHGFDAILPIIVLPMARV